ncbi:WS/DGAT domain-containing protein [Nocardia stercoris]|uniref:DUF1298 domain-containing protein n=1 Tax=Nocardia stercoris TaxID=2483361 RepID=A0A3M2L9P5_9NOCA|nr:WS/DGAT domain-containing protein [Nocardia stercoris]RMI34287.1 DUF1298 domain-containing protein [Nocardia stercoris]
MSSLAPQDATRYWLGRRGCTDLFLLYCFDDTGADDAAVRAELIDRAQRIPDLCLRIQPRRIAYPGLVARIVDGSEVAEVPLAEPTWANVVAAMGELLGTAVDPEVDPWRLHLFRGIAGAPGGMSAALVAVLQISHALVDGRRAAGVARALFGREAPVTGPIPVGDLPSARGRRSAAARGSGSAVRDDARSGREADVGGRAGSGWAVRSSALERLRVVCSGRRTAEVLAAASFPVQLLRTVRRGLGAERARRALLALTAAGELPPPPPGVPATVLNRPPVPVRHAVQLTVRRDLRIPGHTVTVVVLTAISVALTDLLGAPAEVLAAQVSMAVPPGNSHVRNNYRDLSVELHTAESDLRRRAALIATTLADRRRRATHLLQDAQGRVTAVLPAPILRRDVAAQPLDRVPELLAGNTVVSSVQRGPADLTCAGGRVRFTGGFPAVGAVMHLTHGIHGLGDTVTVSVHADPDVVPDIDGYVRRIDSALDEVLLALGP